MQAAVRVRDVVLDAATGSPAVAALKTQLQSLRELLERMDGDAYRLPASRVSGSIGAHVRHCLDHVDALVTAFGQDDLSYDSRLRGTLVETDPLVAMIEIDRLWVELDDVSDAMLARPIQLRSLAARGRAPLRVASTVGRELAFVIQHTIHHCATIAVLLERAGVDLPPAFGYAPSTPVS